ncbi:MAG: hypothetical protein CR993_02535 [Rhodobacterales bacterium]|nr:MAG: hypothetical protein CR993_02535 [Rhodobacterales bacterium]
MLYFRSPMVEPNSPAPVARPYPVAAQFADTRAATCLASSGIAPNTPVKTDRGMVLARDLKRGDMVETLSNGFQPLRWKGESRVVINIDDLGGMQPGTPIRLKAGEAGLPEEAGNLVVAAGQRILTRSGINEMLFGEYEVMVFAADVLHLSGVDVVERPAANWVHLMFDNHEMIAAGGMWLESFLPDRAHLERFHPEIWAEIREAVPALRFESGESRYLENYMTLEPREARLVEFL